MLNYILMLILLAMGIFLLVTFMMDHRKRKSPIFLPPISFIIPAHNSQDHIEKTIKSIYSSYPKYRIELIAINDGSTDKTLEVLEKLKQEYDFTIINNKINKGKVFSLNEAIPLCSNELICSLDSDIIINKRAIEDAIARFENNEKLAAVSCRYKSENPGFITSLQDLEYNMNTFYQVSCNVYSDISMFGGFMILKRKPLIEAGLFSTNAITEDVDLSLKLNRLGWKVELSPCYVLTPSHTNLWKIAKQRTRWSEGVAQCYIKHWKVYLTNPVVIVNLIFWILLLAFGYFAASSGSGTTNQTITNFLYQRGIIKALYSIFAIPYAILGMRSLKQIYKIWLVIPFTILYLPFRGALAVIGWTIGIYKTINLKENERGW